MKESSNDRPWMVAAAEWTSRVTAIALEMVVPGLVGLWIDRQLGTVLLFLVLGMILGVSTGMIHLVRLTAPQDRTDRKKGRPPGQDTPEA